MGLFPSFRTGFLGRGFLAGCLFSRGLLGGRLLGGISRGKVFLWHDDGLGLCDVGLLLHHHPGGLEDLVVKIFWTIWGGVEKILHDETCFLALMSP